MNTALGRTETAYLTNKSGGSVAQGDVVIVDIANASAFTSTTTSAYVNGVVGVVLEPNGIANNAAGLIALGGWVPVVNLSGTGSIGDLIKCHSVAKQGVRHAAVQVAGDFAQALGTSATPAAILFGTVQQGGGSGLAHSYLGYNTVGASLETLIEKRWYAKKITPSTSGLLLSIGAHVKWQADFGWNFQVSVFDDNSNTPGKLLAYNVMGALSGLQSIDTHQATEVARWLDFPISSYLTGSASYWIGLMTIVDTAGAGTTYPGIYYDGSGSDRYWTRGNALVTDPVIETQTDSARIYSLRADFLS